MGRQLEVGRRRVRVETQLRLRRKETLRVGRPAEIFEPSLLFLHDQGADHLPHRLTHLGQELVRC